MFILITVSILFLTALILVVLQFTDAIRYTWLIAASGALFAWFSVFVWQFGMPFEIQLPLWRPAALFPQSPFFVVDGIAWAFAVSLATLCLAVILTAVIRDNFPYPLSWTGVLILTALGILAVTADNPLTLVLLWAAIDVVELIAQMRIVEQPQLSERVVIAFASRLTGILILLWANMVSNSSGIALDFREASPEAGLYLVVAAGLRLGVLPLHLPYPNDSAVRRGFGTGLRMISAGSSLILLARIPASSLEFPAVPFLLLLVALAGVYGAWLWLRAPDELTGRPYWMIGMGALAVGAALRNDPVGAAAWSITLVLVGGAVFLASAQLRWLERSLFIGAWGISALPLSLTATGWEGDLSAWFAIPFLLATHAMLLAGLARHIRRSSVRAVFDAQPLWARNVYPIGILVLLLTLLGLSFFGWDGALQVGRWYLGLIASFLALGLLWLTPRLRILNPVRAHWVRPDNPSWLDAVYGVTWGLYRQLSRLGQALSNMLEGESGIMWTLLFLALFITFFLQKGAVGMSALAWFAVVVLVVTSVGLLLARDWRWLVIFLAAQYFGMLILTLQHWPLGMASVKVVAGWMSAAILGMTRSGLPRSDQADGSSSLPQGRLFRLFAAGIVLLIVIAATPRVDAIMADAGQAVSMGALTLIGMGLLHLGVTNQPMRVAIGLMTTLAGFELLYATVEGSVLVAGLLAIINLGLALAGSYLMLASIARTEETESL